MADPSQGGGTPPLPPNFFDTKPLANYASTILGVTISLVTFCWLAIGARIWTRIYVTKSTGWDDLFVVLAVLMVTMGTVALCVATRFGMGHHIYLIPHNHLSSFLLCHYLDAVSYNCSTALIKLSLLFQYLRVFERGTWTYRITQVLLVLVALWGCMFGFMAWFPCLPDPSALWRMKPKGCYGAGSSDIATVIKWIEAHAGSNMIFDVAVLTLAFRLLFTKDAPSTRMGMMVLLSMGIFSCVFAIWRFAEIIRSRAGISEDLSWNLAGPTLLSFCEIYIASLSASTPFFWPIITKQLNKIFVMYEFNVSTESRYQEDNVELAPAETWKSESKSISGKEDVKSLGRSRSRDESEDPIKAHYRDDFVQQIADPFGEEFRTESAVQGGLTGKKKDGFVRFNNPT